MRVVERELQGKVTSAEAEIQLIKQMRGEDASEDSVSQSEDQKRIDENPTEAA